MLAPHNPSRIARRFDALRAAGELGLVAFVTAGDPSLEATERIVVELAEAGADVVELGVPFSDPIADGPVIQRASERALRAGTTLAGVLELVTRIRRRTDVPVVLFSYFNPILQLGVERFAREATAAGADGVLVTDVTPEEFEIERSALRAAGLDTIFLAAPTTTPERLARIAAASSGFIYLISRAGVTGERDALPAGLPELIRRVRAATPLPIAVGFGISQPGHVSVLGGLADAAVVGSALVTEVERAPTVDAAIAALAEKVRALKRAGQQGMSRRAASAEQADS
jgi:tryptophan synthase alpha chain